MFNIDEIRAELNEYLASNKLGANALARSLGISPAAISTFKAGSYKGNNEAVARKIKSYLVALNAKKDESVEPKNSKELFKSLVRFELGYMDKLEPFADRVNFNFMQWTLKRNAGAVHFTEEQMEWLRLIKDHIVSSLSIVPDDLDLSPFDHKGGLGRFYQVFGDQYELILDEMNQVLVA